MNRKYGILKVIGLLGLGFAVKIFLDKVSEKNDDVEVSYLSLNTVSKYDNSQVKDMVSRVYKSVLKVKAGSNILTSWANKLLTKQSTLYNFLISIISSKINSLNVSSLVQSLYMGVLGRNANIGESSKLISVFNDELRKYGSKERALKRMLTYFVKVSSVVSYCNKLSIKAI